MNRATITAHKVKKSFDGTKAVDDLSFQVCTATCYGFLGPNGAGKTTLMKMVYGKTFRDDPKSSTLNILGYDPHSQSLAIKYVSGVVPQDNNLDTELNVVQNLNIYSKFYNIHPKKARQRIDFLLDFMELSDKHNARIRELSGGMKRRLIIARALIHDPRLLILDEPTTGLDPQVRHLIWSKLRQLKESGITILLTTHYMEEAYQICDTILIMDKGKKVMEGKPYRLLEKHIEPFVLELQDKTAAQMLHTDAAAQEIRIDQSREPAVFYADDIKKLEKLTTTLHHNQYVLRQTNLEDLFLKITGRNLHEHQ